MLGGIAVICRYFFGADTVRRRTAFIAKFPRILAPLKHKQKTLELLLYRNELNLKYLEVLALRCAIFQNLEVLVFLALAKMDGFQSRQPS
jgi:hypothetical protein